MRDIRGAINADDILPIFAGATASTVIAVLVGWRRQRIAEKAAAEGAPPTVFAAIRQLGAGRWRGRWRHGFVTVLPGEIRWRPRRPRPGPPIRLTNVRLDGRPRQQLWYEQWWLAPGVRIYRLTGDADGVYEVAVVAESVRLFEDQIDRRPGVG